MNGIIFYLILHTFLFVIDSDEGLHERSKIFICAQIPDVESQSIFSFYFVADWRLCM